MTVIYTVLDNPEAMARLRASGYTDEQIRAMLATHAQSSKDSPPDFSLVAKYQPIDKE